MKALFNDSAPDYDEDTLFREFKRQSRDLSENLKEISYKYRECPEYPGKDVINSGVTILNSLLPISSSFSFFNDLLQKKDNILNFCDDYENLKTFFSGAQNKIFAEAVKAAQSFERNKYAIFDNDIPDLAENIYAITSMTNPYKEIYRLPELVDKYNKALFDQCQKAGQPLLDSLEDKKKKIFAKLEGKSYSDEFYVPLANRFSDIEQRVKKCTEPCLLDNISREIDRLNTDLLNEIDSKEAELAVAASTGTESEAALPKTQRTKYISMRTLLSSSSWRIETEEDIDTHLAQLKHRILTEMKDDDIISVEF
jgi:hypothetical protein